MTPFNELIPQGSAHASSAILLGALHGMEPGHSKTMMAAFNIAVLGKVKGSDYSLDLDPSGYVKHVKVEVVSDDAPADKVIHGRIFIP